jgi:hypothetical protein
MIVPKVHWLNVVPYLDKKEQPVVLLPRETGVYWTVQGNATDGTAKYAKTEIGDFVRVPVWAYQTNVAALSALFGLGTQIGMSALQGLRGVTSDIPMLVHLVIGSDCTDLRPELEAFRAYVGITFRVK